MAAEHQPQASRNWYRWPRRISRQKVPKLKNAYSGLSEKPYSFPPVHSTIRSRMNGIIFRSFRKWNSSQKNTNTIYSEYSYSGIFPKERAPSFISSKCIGVSLLCLDEMIVHQVFLPPRILTFVTNILSVPIFYYNG